MLALKVNVRSSLQDTVVVTQIFGGNLVVGGRMGEFVKDLFRFIVFLLFEGARSATE